MIETLGYPIIWPILVLNRVLHFWSCVKLSFVNDNYSVLYKYVCVCVRVCRSMRVRVCVCVCVCAYIFLELKKSPENFLFAIINLFQLATQKEKPASSDNHHTIERIFIYIYIYIEREREREREKFGNRFRGWDNGSHFNSYNVKVLGRPLLLSLDGSTLPLIRTL